MPYAPFGIQRKKGVFNRFTKPLRCKPKTTLALTHKSTKPMLNVFTLRQSKDGKTAHAHSEGLILFEYSGYSG